MIRALLTYASILLATLPALFRTRREQAIVELALRQQLATCAQKHPRPRISSEVQGLIRRLATENPWRARRIQTELNKLGINVSLATVSRYLPKKESDAGQCQRWITFLRNHRDAIAAMDFLVVPTARFKLLYIWFVIGHGRKEILHVNMTTHPTAAWVIQQLGEAFPEEIPIRFLIHDNDEIFSSRSARRRTAACGWTSPPL